MSLLNMSKAADRALLKAAETLMLGVKVQVFLDNDKITPNYAEDLKEINEDQDALALRDLYWENKLGKNTAIVEDLLKEGLIEIFRRRFGGKTTLFSSFKPPTGLFVQPSKKWKDLKYGKKKSK